MFLQRPVLSKGLTTTSNCTSKFLPTLMSSMMPLQSSSVDETFATPFPFTYIVTNTGMR